MTRILSIGPIVKSSSVTQEVEIHPQQHVHAIVCLIVGFFECFYGYVLVSMETCKSKWAHSLLIWVNPQDWIQQQELLGFVKRNSEGASISIQPFVVMGFNASQSPIKPVAFSPCKKNSSLKLNEHFGLDNMPILRYAQMDAGCNAKKTND